jgi:hypothetical protein
MENKDKTAFYNPNSYGDDGIGLTKREYFAVMAMQGWISCQHDGFTGDEFTIAIRAIRCADTLLAELENKK